MATTVQIDNEANALLIEHIEEKKALAARSGQPTRGIDKQGVLSTLIKKYLNPTPKKKQAKKDD